MSDPTAIIAILILITVIVIWYALNRHCLNKYGDRICTLRRSIVLFLLVCTPGRAIDFIPIPKDILSSYPDRIHIITCLLILAILIGYIVHLHKKFPLWMSIVALCAMLAIAVFSIPLALIKGFWMFISSLEESYDVSHGYDVNGRLTTYMTPKKRD